MKEQLSDEEVLFSETTINGIKVVPWSFNKLFKLNNILKKLHDKLTFINSIGSKITYADALRLISFADNNLLEVLTITLDVPKEKIYELDIYTGIRLLLAIYYQNKNTIEFKKKENKTSDITLGDIFSMLISNNIGNSLEDLKSNYTIDQIYMFYEKCKRNELSEQKRNAITLAHALVYASPSHDRNSSRKKQTMWDKYINSLEPRKKEKPSHKGLINAFRMMGIPITVRKRSDQ